MGTFSPDSPGLNDLRDVVVKELRALAAAFERDYPDDELALKGILERGRPLVARYARRIEALARLDLEEQLAHESERLERLEVLAGVLHLPRIVDALGAVLTQEGRDPSPAFEALRKRALGARERLEALAGIWQLLQGGEEL